MAKKHWIYIKRGLSEDPKHRAAMGECIWLYMHIIDRADWETGIAYDWKDREEAAEMGMSFETLRDQRQKLERLDYVRCLQKQHGQDIKIMEWRNPREYGSEVKNPRIQGDPLPPPSEFQGDAQGDGQGDAQVRSEAVTPTLDSESESKSSKVSEETKAAILRKGGVGWLVAAGEKVDQTVIDEAVLASDARNTFEKVFGFGTLPWSSNDVWTKFEKLIVEAYKENSGWIAQYVLWRNGEGKYSAFSNRKIRENPQMFIDTGYPEFAASKMYQKPAPQQASEPKEIDTPFTRALDTYVYKPRPSYDDIVAARKNNQSEPLS